MKLIVRRGLPYYDACMSAWCVWMLEIGNLAIGLQFRNYIKWMRCHVQIFRRQNTGCLIPFRITIG
jgi:hypothetical protein